MARIGNLGTDHSAEPDVFGWFGTDIRVDPGAGIALLDWMEQFGMVDEDDPQAIVAVKGLFRSVIHTDDFDIFWARARKYGQTVQDLLAVVQAITEQAAGRPTQPSSGSSAGPTPTEARSKDGSSSRAIARLSGRPDLQLAVYRSQEGQKQQAG